MQQLTSDTPSFAEGINKLNCVSSIKLKRLSKTGVLKHQDIPGELMINGAIWQDDGCWTRGGHHVGRSGYLLSMEIHI